MALVSYDSSGGSSAESDDESNDQTAVTNVVPEVSNQEELHVADGKVSSNQPGKNVKPGRQSLRSKIRSELLKSIAIPPQRESGKTVSIPVPSLSEFDDEFTEDEPKKKRAKSNTTSGLFSMLPPPKNSKGSKELNRPLIPHVVSKAKAAEVSKQVVNKYLKTDNKVEESSEGPVDFFSLSKENEAEDDPSQISNNRMPCTSSSNNSILPPVISTPHDYNQAQNEDLTNETLVTVEQMHPNVDDATIMSSNLPSSTLPENAAAEDPYQDDEFLKLMGKKKGEVIEFIDIHEADQRASREEWEMKTLSEEKPLPSAKKGVHQPNSQQKRKHQITYLAHQAKQRELELKNAWAQNRMTRKQTQAKYGF